MRRNNKILTPLVALGVSITLSAGIFIGLNVHQKEGLKVEAASAHNLDTLYSACESAVSNKSVSGLWSAVKSAAKDGFSQGSYDGLNEWYKTTDIRSDGKIHDYYSNATNFTPGSNECGSYGAEGDCYNREHSIPKSWWGGGTSGQGSDIYIVVPTDGYVNNRRSAFPFGEVSSPTYSSKNGFCKLGPNTYSGYTGTAFEPNNEYKGDFARIYFYAVSKWDSVNFAKGGQGDTTFSSSGTYGLTDYGKNLMYKWHTLDPVSDWELSRQNKCELKQGNRNPFVDHPEYADYLWGGVEIGSETSDDPSLTVSPTTLSVAVDGTATVTATKRNTTDTIYWSVTSGASNISLSASSGSSVTVTGLVEGSSTITVTCGSLSKTVAVTVTSSGGSGGDDPIPDGDEYSILYSDLATSSYPKSEDSRTAASGIAYTVYYCANYSNKMQFKSGQGYLFNNNSLDLAGLTINGLSGALTVYAGSTSHPTSTTITGSNGVYDLSGYNYFTIKNDSSNVATCTSVTITLDSSSSSKTVESIAISNATTTYTQGDTFVKPTVTATYDDGTTGDVTSSATFSGYNMSTVGTQTVTVTYGEKTTTYQITVKAPVTLSSLTLSGSLEKATQFVGDTFDPNGLTVTATYSDSTEENVTSSVTWNPTTLTATTTSIIGSYGGKSVTVTGINVIYPAVTSLSTSGQKTSYNVGDTFSYTGTAIAKYENDTSKTVTSSVVVDSSAVNMNTVGTYNVGLSYTENSVTVSTSYSIQVKEITIVNSIKACYDTYSGSKVSVPNDVYGLYVGSPDNASSIIMNGEYGILLYKVAPDSSWVENQTYLKVENQNSTSKVYLNAYNNLLEINYCDDYVSVVEDEDVIKNNVEPISIYNITGSESSDDITVASRLCLMSGKVTAVEYRSNSTYYDGWKDSNDNRITMSINGNTIHLFVKSSVADSTLGSKFTSALSSGDEITVKGYSSFFTDFQVQYKEVVEADPDYTAENFAQDLLTLTETVCTTSSNKEGDLSGIWLTLETDKYAALAASEKLVLQEAIASNEGTVIQRAMARYDFIIAHYSSLNNFIGRSVTFVGINNHFLLTNSQNMVAIIVIIALISTTSIGAILALRKRKEN